MHLFDSIRTILKMEYHGWGLILSDIKYWRLGGRKISSENLENTEDVSNQVVVITGGNRGLGKASALEFAKRNARVVIGCRNVEEGLKAAKEIAVKTGNENIEVLFLDLSNMDSVASFAFQVQKKYPTIKVLINNAGVTTHNGKNAKTKDGYDYIMAVNHLGHFLLTNLLLDNLKRAAPSRVIVLSSSVQLSECLVVHDLNNNCKGSFGLKAIMPYSNSKYANSLFAKELGKRLEGTGVSAYSLCPGTVKTTIMDNASLTARITFALTLLLAGHSPETSASEFIVYQALSKKLGNEIGGMFRLRKPLKAVNKKLQENIAKNLWDCSADLVKLEDRLLQLQQQLRDKL